MCYPVPGTHGYCSFSLIKKQIREHQTTTCSFVTLTLSCALIGWICCRLWLDFQHIGLSRLCNLSLSLCLWRIYIAFSNCQFLGDQHAHEEDLLLGSYIGSRRYSLDFLPQGTLGMSGGLDIWVHTYAPSENVQMISVHVLKQLHTHTHIQGWKEYPISVGFDILHSRTSIIGFVETRFCIVL